MGYRYGLNSLSYEYGKGLLNITANWENRGLTPTYNDWFVKYIVIDAEGNKVWEQKSSIDLRKFLPGEQTVSEQFNNVPQGKLYVTVQDKYDVYRPMVLDVMLKADISLHLLERNR